MSDLAFLNVFNGAVPGAGSLIQSALNGGQSFTTIPVNNSRLALYTLAIRDGSSPFSMVSQYTFPLSPAMLSKRWTAMSNIFDVSSTSPGVPGGIERVVDMYGNAPPDYAIEGTTGWQLHSSDGYTMTGLQSIKNLELFFAQFAALNQQQARLNKLPFVMEFYDYFRSDFYQVIPVGRQELRQNKARPLLIDYSFRFAAIRDLRSPLVAEIADVVLEVLQNPGPTAIMTATNFVSSFVANLAGTVPGSTNTVDLFASAGADAGSSVGSIGGGLDAFAGSTSNDNIVEDLL